MSTKVIRFVEKLKLSEDKQQLLALQKMNLPYFLTFGLISFLFKKRNPTVCNVSDITSIDIKASFWEGRLIRIFTQKHIYKIEMRSKAAFEQAKIDIIAFKLPVTITS